MVSIRILPLKGIASHLQLRGDAKYRLLWGIKAGLLFPESCFPSFPLKHGLLPFQAKKIKKGEIEGQYQIIELEDVEQRTGAIIDKHPTDEVGSDKLLFGPCDVLTTRLRPNLGKTFLNNPTEQLIGTTEWIPLKANPDRILPQMLKYLLLSPRYIDNALGLLSGKQHPRISEENLYNLRVPFPPLAIQHELIAKVQEIESCIQLSRERLRKPVDLINEILCDAFHYPLAEHIARERETHFNRRLSDFGHALTLRGSSRFHHPDGALIDTYFAKTPHEPLKHSIAVPIRLGATLTQKDLDDDGEAYCVHPSAIRREDGIDPQNCLRVGLEFYNAAKQRFGLRDGDIVMARSGEGTIGKSALFEEQAEEAFLFSDFTMRVRLSSSISPRFAAYYFRSVMFQQQVEREKRGMGNMTNIFPPQVGAMLIPTASRERQDDLAETTALALKSLQDDQDAIEAGRAEINALIEAALR